ncbi:MAG: Phage shock protein C, PspC [Parcubacteria group bacterium GW2011_GWA1_59_11]|nr:MAG: Phage shock protein C, PspC [Parcubacteria group bacterium GW2011_GWA1_59_11]
MISAGISYNTRMEYQTKRLYRSREERVLAGVCGGLAEYFAVDPVLMRVGFVVLGLLNGIGVLGYIILALVVQEKPGEGPRPAAGDDAERAVNAVKEGFQAVRESAEKPKGSAPGSPEPARVNRGRFQTFLGAALILIAVFIFADQVFRVIIPWRVIWPSLILVLGLYFLLRPRR